MFFGASPRVREPKFPRIPTPRPIKESIAEAITAICDKMTAEQQAEIIKIIATSGAMDSHAMERLGNDLGQVAHYLSRRENELR